MGDPGDRGVGHVAKDSWLRVSTPEEYSLVFVPAARAELCDVVVMSRMSLFALKFVKRE